MNELENKLNSEYKKIGSIVIKKTSDAVLKADDINYVKSIMEKVEPLKSSEPIVVSKDWKGFTLIDGYHRLKFHKENNLEIKCVVLEDYKIDRKNDTLLEFMKGIIGDTIKFLSDYVFVLNDKIYYIEANEGCGGCTDGWSSFEVLAEVLNRDIKIKSVEARNENEDVYDLFINEEKVAKVDTGYGDGYYGGDFEIKI
jgi:hypothetical protein